MKKIDLLDFLNFENSVTAKAVAERFDVSLGAVYNTLTSLNIQGLVRKIRGNDGVLIFSITDKGKERLDYLSEKEDDDNNFGESLEVKSNVGGKRKMPRIEILDGLYECPECGTQWDLEDVPADSEDAYCDSCDCALELVSTDGSEAEEDEEIVEPVRRRR